jgi:enoyl-CoA hydratase
MMTDHTMCDTPPLRVEWPFAGCAVVTLDRPRARNALSRALRRGLARTFTQLRNGADASVIVLTGAGDAFCAGLDLKELGAEADPSSALAPDAEEDPVRAMEAFPGPIIGAINGPAMTGGFELALACDLLVASTRAVFGDTHARVGALPGWGLSQRLPRLIGPGRARELSLTGNLISAQRAETWGLVNRVVSPEQLLPQALKLAADMLSVVPDMLPAYKRLINDGLRVSLAEGLALEAERSRAWAATVSAESIEQRRAGLLARGRTGWMHEGIEGNDE